MECIACSRNFDSFLCSASKEEVETFIRPNLLALEEFHKKERHPNYFVSTLETLEKELEKQKKIKENPYQSSTLSFGRLIKKEPIADCYFVMSSSLSELYIVPFDIFYPTNAIDGDSVMFGYCDSFSFYTPLELANHSKAYRKENYLPFSHSDEHKKRIKDFYLHYIESHGITDGMWIFSQLYVYYQSEDISFVELEDIVRKYQKTNLVPEHYFKMDQVHLRNDTSLIIPPMEKEKKRSLIEERDWIKNFTKTNEHKELVSILLKEHYIDDIITYNTYKKLIEDNEKFLDSLSEKERKRHFWYQLVRM